MRDVAIGFARAYGKGIYPSIATNTSQIVIDVHQSQASETLWYQVGSLEGGYTAFGESRQYDTGRYPCITLNNKGVIVEVHESDGFSNNMWYHVGVVNSDNMSISWGGSQKYDTGKFPRVAMNSSGIVVEVHEADGISSNLWYHVGKVNPDNKSVEWGGSRQYDTGQTPSVAINSHGVLVEVHQSDGLSTNLWYHVGTVNQDNKTIEWGESYQYDSGSHPSVVLTDDFWVIEIHQSQTFNTLWKRIGRLNLGKKTIEWIGGSEKFSNDGSLPCIGFNGTQVVESHMDGTDLMSSASLFIDRSDWMKNSMPVIGGRSLKEVMLPAAHDASMYEVNNCTALGPFGANSCNTQTQTASYLGQLNNGVRYFDVRPVIFQGKLSTGHFNTNPLLGCDGPGLDTALADVKIFMARSSELVILKFSHYLNRDKDGADFTEEEMDRLCSEVLTALDGHLYTGPMPLAATPLNIMTARGGRVVAVFDNLSAALHQKYAGKGIYSYRDYPTSETADLTVFDHYTGTPDLEVMINDQLGKLENPENHGGDLFLLSWTLTQDTEQAIACGAGIGISILTMAASANSELWKNMEQLQRGGNIRKGRLPNLLYHDYAQGFATDIALWLNNGGSFENREH
ncbi:hypothetical protein BTA51_13965 [Hahella sp. CCB-MM4]|uniref:hypothetical protein n=1 Tax=Hahella sp. (strain CCB-MM4) TaxID=1926491 RepID=UPI000B9AB12D|nr:hypothetical protein [Hahella sp. CCB-MM4]OZG72631.1 hypothetical protein BTA51_13965 [Hahella sp. CCB-MM4]